MSACLPYDGQPGVCARCGVALTGRKRRWCSVECEDTYWREHAWNLARPAALRRDGYRCVACGSDGREVLHNRVGGEFVQRRLEVNHRQPLRGASRRAGCHHHLDNLETLCRRCHVAVTAAQRRARSRGQDDAIDARELMESLQDSTLDRKARP